MSGQKQSREEIAFIHEVKIIGHSAWLKELHTTFYF